MNKRHWSTIAINGSIGRQLLQWSGNSYDLVVQSLSKKQRLEAGL
jgi:predicted DNA-binding protein (MmcQ/YjbR family)